ncbi:RecQ family ATP-dependent DNA helicase [Novosphingobium sp. FSY-8]|uniref:ATP-dependent DNA helicase RecQ n=1 Tax=Novosphingobium ovatum TaxID=1908523 RepID=A0ABW9XGC8_9SPHN|nr:ATP-dependent DNA helicase RecQ [Novosphingobium ovatum]NBC37615.1 RecQ family ATP-dependent DNA helicase [Novosphingobium ovatum]
MMAHMEALDTLLHERFGHTALRGIQGDVIGRVMAGASTLAIMPTGGGKSLTYQLPALALPGTAVVISPLIALMQDQMRAARAAGIRAATLTSADPDQRRTEAALRGGALDLIYVAPERAIRPDFAEALTGLAIPLFAVDEAHCVSHWGHDFRPDYRALMPLMQAHPDAARLCLTATADAHTRADICAHFAIPPEGLLIGGFDRPNIHYAIQPRRRPVEQLSALIRGADGASIIYCRTRRQTEQLADELARTGRRVLTYHAGLANEIRAARAAAFLASEDMVMVATIAFGMGVDKPNVRLVAHLSPPDCVEAYYQETGRAGRDGAPARAVMLWAAEDLKRARHRLHGMAQDRRPIEAQRLRAMTGLIRTWGCRRGVLLRYFGQEAPPACGNCDHCTQAPWRVRLVEGLRSVGRFLTSLR